MVEKELQTITNEIVKKGRIPINGGIEILSKCNFRCIHCYNAMESAECMTYEFANEIAEQLKYMGTMHVYLTGGEVLLHPQFEKIYKCFREKGIVVSVLTNASLINEEYLRLFREYTPYNIDISLYGITNETYEAVTGIKDGFDKVKKSIQKLSENNITFSLKAVILKENIHELNEMLDFANVFGKKIKIYTDIRPLNNGEQISKKHQLSIEQIIEVERQTKRWEKIGKLNNEKIREQEQRRKLGYFYFCELGKYNFFITYKGMLHGCAKERRHGYDLHKMSFGQGFKCMLNDIVKKKGIGSNKCMVCKYIKYCDYCPAQFELETGDALNPPEMVCELAKRRYLCFD